jgi:hypothetical protein
MEAKKKKNWLYKRRRLRRRKIGHIKGGGLEEVELDVWMRRIRESRVRCMKERSYDEVELDVREEKDKKN